MEHSSTTQEEIELKIMEIKRIKNRLKELKIESSYLPKTSTQERTKRMKIRLHELQLERNEKELKEFLEKEFCKQVLLPPITW